MTKWKFLREYLYKFGQLLIENGLFLIIKNKIVEALFIEKDYIYY